MLYLGFRGAWSRDRVRADNQGVTKAGGPPPHGPLSTSDNNRGTFTGGQGIQSPCPCTNAPRHEHPIPCGLFAIGCARAAAVLRTAGRGDARDVQLGISPIRLHASVRTGLTVIIQAKNKALHLANSRLTVENKWSSRGD